MNSETMFAGSLTAGCQVAERDGYLLTVSEVVKQTPKTITVKLTNPMGMTMRDGCTVTLRKSSKVVGFRPEAQS